MRPLAQRYREQVDVANSHLPTDGGIGYRVLGREFQRHEWIDHAAPRYEDEPDSLAPLDYETALRALLQVDPNSEPVAENMGETFHVRTLTTGRQRKRASSRRH